jgi:S-adenosylmethionine synthetase
MSEIVIYASNEPAVAEQALEIVERKGVGHPDTICDGIMEDISIALCREYRRRFGMILHHNIDKGLLVAGQVEHGFGGGRVLEPMRLVIGDRATFELDGKRLEVPEIAVATAQAWIRKHLPHVDPEAHVRYEVELKPGSEELTGLFGNRRQATGILGANDTSAAVGYAPLSETERLVLGTERYLNGAHFKRRFPGTGQDVKVMGLRQEEQLELTVAMPILDRYLARGDDYFEMRGAIQQELTTWLGEQLQSFSGITAELNTLDRPDAGMAGMYLTVTGTSAEDADSGQVGRGNRVNGLITLHRPMSLESAAGKNPLSHVGKIYNVLAHQLAASIYDHVPGLREVTVWLLSRIGQAIDQPRLVSVRVQLQNGATLEEVREAIEERVESALAQLPSFCEDLAAGRYPVW